MTVERAGLSMNWTGVVVACGLVLGGCRRDAADQGGDGTRSPVVARVGQTAITADDVRAELARQPEFARARYASPDKHREFLETLIRTRLLVEEARRTKLDEASEVRAAVDRLLSQQVVQKELSGIAPDEQALRDAFEAHRAEYSRAERVRAAVVLFSAPKGAPGRAAVKAEAERELSRLRALKPDARADAFLALIRKRSDHDGSRTQDGDLGPRTLGELEAQYGEHLAVGLFATKEAGALTGVLESDLGFWLARVVSRQPGEERGFDAVRAQLQPRVTAELRARALEALVERLKRGSAVTVDEAELAKVWSTGGPASPPSAPRPSEPQRPTQP